MEPSTAPPTGTAPIIGRPSPVERARRSEWEAELAVRYTRDGDLHAREELVERFLPLARELALRYSYTDEPFDDLLQVACLGLLKAVDRFEPGRGTKFTTYAVPTILGELKRHFRDKGWALHVPRDLQERALAVNRHTERLSARLGRSPAVHEVAAEMECSREEVLEAAEAAATYEAASLDAPVSSAPDQPGPLLERVGSEDGAFLLVESREAIAQTWRDLPVMERRVVRLRFLDNLTQREIGERIGFSQMHVSRLLRRALRRLETAAA